MAQWSKPCSVIFEMIRFAHEFRSNRSFTISCDSWRTENSTLSLLQNLKEVFNGVIGHYCLQMT